MGWEVAGKCSCPRGLQAEMHLNFEGRVDFSPHVNGWKGIDECPEAQPQKYVWRQPCSPSPSPAPTPVTNLNASHLGGLESSHSVRHFGNWVAASPLSEFIGGANSQRNEQHRPRLGAIAG